MKLLILSTAGRHPFSLERTATFGYVRLHGAEQIYASRDRAGDLDRWAKRIAEWAERNADVYVYFDNDARGHAPHDALRLLTNARVDAHKRR